MPTVGRHNIIGGNSSTVSSGTSLSTTYSPTAGNGVLVIIPFLGASNGDGPVTQTVTDIQNQSSSSISGFVASPGTRYQLNAPGPDDEGWAAYYCPAIASGVTAIKAVFSATVYFPQVIVFEIATGTIETTNFWDANDASSVTGGSGSSHSVSFTNAYTDDLLISYLHSGQRAGPPYSDTTGDADWTTVRTSPTDYIHNGTVQFKDVTSISTQTATITWPTYSLQGFSFVAGLKAIATQQHHRFQQAQHLMHQTPKGRGWGGWGRHR